MITRPSVFTEPEKSPSIRSNPFSSRCPRKKVPGPTIELIRLSSLPRLAAMGLEPVARAAVEVGLGKLEEVCGVDVLRADPDLEVEVRSGGHPGIAHRPDTLPLDDVVALVHVHTVHVSVFCLEAVVMVDLDEAAVAAHGIEPGVGHDTVRCRYDRSTGVERNVDSLVHVPDALNRMDIRTELHRHVPVTVDDGPVV